MSGETSKREVLKVQSLSKAFGATQALQAASLTVQAGEVHILLGENGAGKSTLAKIVAGIHGKDSGTVVIDGQEVSIESAQHARSLGIAIVFQELSLAPHLSVMDNLFLGSEKPRHPFSLLKPSEERERGVEVLRRLKLDLPPNKPVYELTIAEKQMLEIAKALLQNPSILIMDEPTSTLTEREKTFLFDTIGRLRENGVAILYVTHHLREVFEIGDRVSTMFDGAVTVTEQVTSELTEARLLEMLTGRQICTAIARSPRVRNEPLLTVEGLRTADGCQGVDLTVWPGEVVGIYGVVGCGRESLGRTLVGLTQPVSGQMIFAGEPYEPRHPAHAVSLGVGYMPMDRKEQGILAERPIRENLTLSNLQSYCRHGLLSERLERDDSERRLSALTVRCGSMEDRITSLSGGNQQKVLFGRAIAHQPRLLVMEDPTAGIDMGAKFDLYPMMRQWADRGFSFLLLSSDLAETLLLCDRTYTMYQGRMVDEIDEPTLDDEERVLASVLGRNGGPREASEQAAPVAGT